MGLMNSSQTKAASLPQAEAEYTQTIHWASNKNGFDTILCFYNYYGHVFKELDSSLTDATIKIRFYEEQDGKELQAFEKELPTGKSFHIPVSEIHPGFQGIVGVSIEPNGRMPRRSWKPEDGQPREIRSSYFAIYKREGGYSDFSHELYPVEPKPAKEEKNRSQILMIRPNFRSGIVLANNRAGQSGKDFESNLQVRLFELSGELATESVFKTRLAPGASRVLFLDEMFPRFDFNKFQQIIANVSAKNLEHPMSIHMFDHGDFNFHHF